MTAVRPSLPQIGDAAAAQSPLSFGGFGAMLRHLPRLAAGVDDALHEDRLSKGDLGLLQPYQPSLSAAWLFQRWVDRLYNLHDNRSLPDTTKQQEAGRCGPRWLQLYQPALSAAWLLAKSRRPGSRLCVVAQS